MDGYLQDKTKKIEFSVATVLTAIGILFISLGIPLFEGGILFAYRFLITFWTYLLVATVYIIYLIFFFFGKEALSRTMITGLVLIDFFLIIFYILLATGFWKIVHDVESFRNYLSASGGWMDILFVALQFLQVVVLPIPSFATLVAGTALFGALKCFLYSYFAIVIGSVVAFFIGKFLGVKAVSWIVGEDTLKKWLKKVKGKDNLVLTAMFLLPFFPDDVLCFVAGISSMSIWYFVGMILVARAISVSMTCFSIDFIPFNTWWGILCWVVIGVVVGLLFYLYYRYQDKLQDWLHKIRRKKKIK